MNGYVTCSQERFLNDIFSKKSKDVFSDVNMMLFVFDVASKAYEVRVKCQSSFISLLDRLEDLSASNGEVRRIQSKCIGLCTCPQDGLD